MIAEDGKYGRVWTSGKDIPPDEPVFILRGQDVLAPRAIRAYADELERESVRRNSISLERMAEECHVVADQMLHWQNENAHRTRLPD